MPKVFKTIPVYKYSVISPFDGEEIANGRVELRMGRTMSNMPNICGFINRDLMQKFGTRANRSTIKYEKLLPIISHEGREWDLNDLPDRAGIVGLTVSEKEIANE